jgi:hypothetical protein
MSSRFDRQTFTISYGIGIPHSGSGLRQFWNRGSSGSASFLIHVGRPVSVGLGVDLAFLPFDKTAFAVIFPAVPLQAKDLVLTNVYVVVKYSPAPTMRLQPFLSLNVGVLMSSKAEYREVINDVRVTYYNIAGITRLAGGLGAGIDLWLAPWIALQAEAKGVYVHNDRNIEITSAFRGGFRFTF